MKLGLGTWRFFLAALVAVSHLWAGMIDGPAAYAVWGFFVLSGYLMTLVLSTRYGPTTCGLRRFACNRLLRIVPLYAVAGVLGVVTILVLRRAAVDPAGLNPQFMLPQNRFEWFGNVFMLPLMPERGLVVPVASALFVEVWAYALMPIFAHSRSAALAWLIATLCANLQYGFGMDTFIPRYCGFATGLMPFAVGALACHYRRGLRRRAMPRLSIVLWCAHGAYWLRDPAWPWTYGLYLSVPLSAWVALSLAEAGTGAIDRFAGALSYPAYLLHTTVAAWFLPWFGFGRDLPFFAVSMTATLMVSTALLMLVDRPMQRLRRTTLDPAPLRVVRRATNAAADRSVAGDRPVYGGAMLFAEPIRNGASPV